MNDENKVNLTVIETLSEPLKETDPNIHYAINHISVKCEREGNVP